MLRAILFDFNGVLADDEPIHFELFRQVLREEGLDLSADDYYERLIGYDDRDCLRAVLEEARQPADPERLSRLIARKSTYYQERIRRDGFPFFAGAAELVADIAASGLTLGLVSGALRGEIEGALAGIGVRDRFKCLVAAEDVTHGKPDPEGYRRGLHGLNAPPRAPFPSLQPHEVLAIEDTPAGLEAAQAAGLNTLGVAQTHSPSQLGRADRVVPSVRDLSARRLQDLFASR